MHPTSLSFPSENMAETRLSEKSQDDNNRERERVTLIQRRKNRALLYSKVPTSQIGVLL